MGLQDGDNRFCNTQCRDHYKHPGFCAECVAETTNESPGNTGSINGIGVRLYGASAKCPKCLSVIKRKWFSIIFIPVIPLKRYRIKPMTATRYLGRFLPAANVGASRARTG
jgi:hypothetical protein